MFDQNSQRYSRSEENGPQINADARGSERSCQESYELELASLI
jgi:hypothetical protein